MAEGGVDTGKRVKEVVPPKKGLLSRFFGSRPQSISPKTQSVLDRVAEASRQQESIQIRAEKNPTYSRVKGAVLERVALDARSQAIAVRNLNDNIRNNNSTLMQFPIIDRSAEQRGLAILSGLGMLSQKSSQFGERTLSDFYDGTGGHIRTFSCREEKGYEKISEELRGIQARVMYDDRGQSGRGLPTSFEITANQDALGRLREAVR